MKKTKSSDGRILLLYINRLGTGNLYQNTEPLGLKALAAFIEEKGYSSYVYSGSVHEAVKLAGIGAPEKTPAVVGLYCDFETLSAVESFSRFLKENTSAKVFVGGPQAVALGEEFLKRSLSDAVVRGEGEYPLYELLEFFTRGAGRLEDIAGVSYIDAAGNFIKIPPRPPIDKLDLLPLRRSGIDGTARKAARNYSILTGRGCPFSCAFCYEGSVSGGVRLRGVDNSLREIRQALEFNPGIKYIWFADDTFTLSPARMEAFSKGLSEIRKEHDFVWFCECHPRAMLKWPDTLSMMIEAGLVRMQIGMESGDAGIISMYNKQAVLEDIENLTRLAYKSGLAQLTGNMIIGGAAETKASFAKTVSFSKKLIDAGPGMTDITSTFFIPLPKTAISENPEKFGIKILDPRSITSIGDMAVIETGRLSREQIVSMRLDFTRKILRKMVDAYKKGRIPVKRIVDEFRINEKYGLESNWYRVVFSADRFINEYYKKMSSGRFISSDGMPFETLMGLYPAAVMDFIDLIDLVEGFPKIGGSVLSPLEYRLVSLCGGRLPLSALLDKCFGEFGQNYHSKNDFVKAAVRLIKRFEKNLWIGFSAVPARAEDTKNEILNFSNTKYTNIEYTNPAVTSERAFIEMPAGAGVNEFRPAVENLIANGAKIITGRIASVLSEADTAAVIKTADTALTLISEYPGVFEAFYDDGYLRTAVFEGGAQYEEHAAAAQTISSKIARRMLKVHNSKSIKFETALAHFILHEQHCIDTIYYARIFSSDPLVYNYFTVISRGAAQRTADAGIAGGAAGPQKFERSSFRPQRVMAVWTALDFERGYPAVGRDVLSPLEYELLLYCTGKSTLGEIYDIIFAKFARCFGGFDELKKAVDQILSGFEKKYWILYSRI